MADRSTATAMIASRPSFATAASPSRCERFSPPSKIRKTCGGSASNSRRGSGSGISSSSSSSNACVNVVIEGESSIDNTTNTISSSSRLGDCFTNAFGFAPNEFIFPWEENRSKINTTHNKTPATLDPRVMTTTLHDDALGECLFSGFLDTLETVRLATVSKRFSVLASAHVRRLDLRRLSHLSVPDIESIVRRFPNLKDLDLDYCTSFGALHLEALLPLSASLERLSLKGCLIADDCLSSMLGKMSQANGGTGTRLLSLDLSAVDHAGSQRVGDVSCQAISKYCPNLKSLGLAWCKNVTDVGFRALVQQSRDTTTSPLEELDVSLTGITDDSIHGLQQLLVVANGLVKLDLSATQVSGEAFFTGLAAEAEAATAKSHQQQQQQQQVASSLPLKELVFQFMPDMTLESLQSFLDSPSFALLERVEVNWGQAADKQTTAVAVTAAIDGALERNYHNNNATTTTTSTTTTTPRRP